MRQLIVLLVCFGGILASSSKSGQFVDDIDEKYDAYQLIASKRYPIEEHEVQTEDGYRLTIQRIKFGVKNSALPRKATVFLQHGLFGASTNFITNLASESLAFILADAGYDVWIGNNRGNTYGKKHATLTTDDHRFWQFSWDEMAKYDLPAMIDHALEVTGQTSLYYVGHSQGTMTMFAKLSEDPIFAKKIRKFFAMGPVTTVGHITGLLSQIAPYTTQVQTFLKIFGVDEFLPTNWLLKSTARYLCGWFYTNQQLCTNIYFQVGGMDSIQFNMTRLPVYLAHSPAGTSTQNVAHFGQMVLSDQFQKYDYGDPATNLRHYGQFTPPLYDLTKVNTPVYLFWGEKDIAATPQNVAKMIPLLPNLVENNGYSDFNHLDFIWGLRAPRECYSKILAAMDKDTCTNFMKMGC